MEQQNISEQEQHLKFMKEAVLESKKSLETSEGDPFGAVVVKNGQIIARGHNQIILLNDPTAHGEMQAIRNAGKNLNTWKLNDCILYSSCEPCAMCQTAAIWSGIKTVYYAMSAIDLQEVVPVCTEGYAREQINAKKEERHMPFYQIKEFVQEAKDLFKDGIPTEK